MPQPSPQLLEAIGLFRAGNKAEAEAVLTKLVAAHPRAARAWLLLGRIRHALGQNKAAVQAFQRAARSERYRGDASLGIGLAYASMGDVKRAFHYLLAARRTGTVDTTRVGVSAAAKLLRADPRYRSLFPSAAELAHPFVEPVVILHQWVGEHAGDQFGWIARDAGDVDRDGVDDVVTSAPTNADGGRNAGKVYLYSGKSGKELWSHTGARGGQLGNSVEAAGDVNGDGVPDVVAGAPFSDTVLLLSGNSGKVLRTITGEKGEWLGKSVAGAGDVDGDRHADIIIGAPKNSDAGAAAGAAYVYSGRTGNRLLTIHGERAGDRFGSACAGWSDGTHRLVVVGAPNAGPNHHGRVYIYKRLDDKPTFVIDAGSSGRRLGGMFVSVVGDVNGDGVADVYASDWSDASRGPITGRVYLISGADGSIIRTHIGETARDGFGIGAAKAGDVDRDGHADVVVGAWRYSGAAPAGGKVYLFSGRDGSLMRAITGRVMGETFGFDATGIGDVDGDGVPDLLLTSAWSAVNGPRSGRVYIISGAAPR